MQFEKDQNIFFKVIRNINLIVYIHGYKITFYLYINNLETI